MTLFEKHQALIEQAIAAGKSRTFWTPYPENPKAYGEGMDEAGKAAFSAQMTQDYKELLQDGEAWVGEEFSPYLQLGIGVKYPQSNNETIIAHATKAQELWGKTNIQTRAGLLVESLERVKARFFEIAYATMHTTGQAYMMSFQASGPHANDRALEAIAIGYQQITSIEPNAVWTKPMGKFDLTLQKNFKAMPKGVGLVIGCSTFPIWNTVPGLYADLICGNVCIVKPHPKAILPIAIVVAEIQKLLKENGIDPMVVQLAVDTVDAPVTKQLAENKDVKLIDFTGSSAFGDYIETIPNKTTFTEKAGVNCVILDSVKDIKAVAGNIAFSASLYSGQMCTAPQNIYIPESGINTAEGHLSYEDARNAIVQAITDLADNPKMGPHILGTIQSDATLKRLQNAGTMGGNLILATKVIANPEFEHARVYSPAVIELTSADENIYKKECFGPIVFIIKTRNTDESLHITKNLSIEIGAITCLAFCTDKNIIQHIEETMNQVYTPVSFNLGGAAFVNSHSAFSDFHVTGGNPSGNASFTNSEYLSKRFVWVGNRMMD